ncbi:MAG: hypothetical protein WAX89_05350 [Alphaproteobacteria bacterium]
MAKTAKPVAENPFAAAESETHARIIADFWRQVESFARESDGALLDAIKDPLKPDSVSRFILYPHKGGLRIPPWEKLASDEKFRQLQREVIERKMGLSLMADEEIKQDKFGVRLTLRYSSFGTALQRQI